LGHGGPLEKEPRKKKERKENNRKKENKLMLPKVKTLQEFYSRPSRWTKEALARDRHGEETQIDSDAAEALCLSAAVAYVYGHQDILRVTDSLLEVINEGLDNTQAFDDLAAWNDASARSFHDIRWLVTRANL
jgi:hypothetical protein